MNVAELRALNERLRIREHAEAVDWITEEIGRVSRHRPEYRTRLPRLLRRLDYALVAYIAAVDQLDAERRDME